MNESQEKKKGTVIGDLQQVIKEMNEELESAKEEFLIVQRRSLIALYISAYLAFLGIGLIAWTPII